MASGSDDMEEFIRTESLKEFAPSACTAAKQELEQEARTAWKQQVQSLNDWRRGLRTSGESKEINQKRSVEWSSPIKKDGYAFVTVKHNDERKENQATPLLYIDRVDPLPQSTQWTPVERNIRVPQHGLSGGDMDLDVEEDDDDSLKKVLVESAQECKTSNVEYKISPEDLRDDQLFQKLVERLRRFENQELDVRIQKTNVFSALYQLCPEAGFPFQLRDRYFRLTGINRNDGLSREEILQSLTRKTVMDRFNQKFCRRCYVYNCLVHGGSEKVDLSMVCSGATNFTEQDEPCSPDCYKIPSPAPSVSGLPSAESVDTVESASPPSSSSDQEESGSESDVEESASPPSSTSDQQESGGDSDAEESAPPPGSDQQESGGESDVELLYEIDRKGTRKDNGEFSDSGSSVVALSGAEDEGPKPEPKSQRYFNFNWESVGVVESSKEVNEEGSAGEHAVENSSVQDDNKDADRDESPKITCSPNATQACVADVEINRTNDSVVSQGDELTLDKPSCEEGIEAMDEPNCCNKFDVNPNSLRQISEETSTSVIEEAVEEDTVRQRSEEVGRDDFQSEWSIEEIELYLELRRVFPGQICAIASIMITKTCRQVFEFSRRESFKCRMTNLEGERRSVDSLIRAAKSWGIMSEENKMIPMRSVKPSVFPLYTPCKHPGECDRNNCPCVVNGLPCEKFCACFYSKPGCSNQFPGCHCSGGCDVPTCRCFSGQRECDVDICTCWENHPQASDPSEPVRCQCENAAIQNMKGKKVRKGVSSIAGWGLFAAEPIQKDEHVGEYLGEILPTRESDRRGLIYDQNKRTYLFTRDTSYTLDGMHFGSMVRFMNASKKPNCYPMVKYVYGDCRIGMYAAQDIAEGEELTFDYMEVIKQQSSKNEIHAGSEIAKVASKSWKPSILKERPSLWTSEEDNDSSAKE